MGLHGRNLTNDNFTGKEIPDHYVKPAEPTISMNTFGLIIAAAVIGMLFFGIGH